jgi:hypothetical protein
MFKYSNKGIQNLNLQICIICTINKRNEHHMSDSG